MSVGRIIARAPRKPHGQAFAVLGIIIGVFVVGALGLFSVEVMRMQTARQQLSTACDITALAAAADLATSDPTMYPAGGGDRTEAEGGPQESPVVVQAKKNALVAFRDTYVLGASMRDADSVGSEAELASVGPGKGKVLIEFLDLTGTTTGRSCRVTAVFGLVPLSGSFLNLGQSNITAISTAGIPKLDIILCVDVSGSMDDATPVTFVKRYWDKDGQDKSQAGAATGCVKYEIARNGAAQGKLLDILKPPPVGSSVNALPPQNLDTAEKLDQSEKPLFFDEKLRGLPPPNRDLGSPPRNKLHENVDHSNPEKFTDVVVNINGKDSFESFTAEGLAFPNLAALVEAARGNLNNSEHFHNSGADTALFGLVTPNSEYKAVYRQEAKKHIQPLSDATFALISFLNTMKADTDAHFGFIAFSTPVEDPLRNIAYNYPQGGRYRRPVCPVHPLRKDKDNFDEIYSQLYSEDRTPNLTAAGMTDIADAINKALTQFKNNTRSGAKKAILIFTDGEPMDATGDRAQAKQAALDAAKQAQQAAIPIFTVALPLTKGDSYEAQQLVHDQGETLNEMSKISGGKFFWGDEGPKLRGAFQRIAIRLVSLTK